MTIDNHIILQMRRTSQRLSKQPAEKVNAEASARGDTDNYDQSAISKLSGSNLQNENIDSAASRHNSSIQKSRRRKTVDVSAEKTVTRKPIKAVGQRRSAKGESQDHSDSIDRVTDSSERKGPEQHAVLETDKQKTDKSKKARSKSQKLVPDESGRPKQPSPRKAARPKAEEAKDWPDRTTLCPKFIGAHVSISGGVDAAWNNANEIGADAMAFFVKNQRQWASKPIGEEVIARFSEKFGQPLPPHGRGYSAGSHVVVHGSYLVNLANPDPVRNKQALHGYLDDLKKCEVLGIGYLNIHPGSTCGQCDKSTSISQIARAIDEGHQQTANVVTLLETMAGRGNVIGGTFEDLRAIIDQVKDQSRVGVCLDTCHVFAAGYDLRDNECVSETLSMFDKVIGLKFLKALHVNDSKGSFESFRDLHENIGFGHIGLDGFHALINTPALDGIPFILETPPREPSFWLSEIRALQMMHGLDASEMHTITSLLENRGPRLKDTQAQKSKDSKNRGGEKTQKKRKGQKSASPQAE